jgi:hypothetical protein
VETETLHHQKQVATAELVYPRQTVDGLHLSLAEAAAEAEAEETEA